MNAVIGTWNGWIVTIHDVLYGFFQTKYGLVHGLWVIGNDDLFATADMIDHQFAGLSAGLLLHDGMGIQA
jgi:hypothetical protein